MPFRPVALVRAYRATLPRIWPIFGPLRGKYVATRKGKTATKNNYVFSRNHLYISKPVVSLMRSKEQTPTTPIYEKRKTQNV